MPAPSPAAATISGDGVSRRPGPRPADRRRAAPRYCERGRGRQRVGIEAPGITLDGRIEMADQARRRRQGDSCWPTRSPIVATEKARRPVNNSCSTDRARRCRAASVTRAPAAARRHTPGPGARVGHGPAAARSKSVGRTLPGAVEHHVGRLQIAGSTPRAWCNGKRAQGCRELPGLVLREPADPPQRGGRSSPSVSMDRHRCPSACRRHAADVRVTPGAQSAPRCETARATRRG
jgi:hypothetical protein